MLRFGFRSEVFIMRLDLKKFFFGDDVMQNIDYSFCVEEIRFFAKRDFRI